MTDQGRFPLTAWPMKVIKDFVRLPIEEHIPEQGDFPLPADKGLPAGLTQQIGDLGRHRYGFGHDNTLYIKEMYCKNTT